MTCSSFTAQSFYRPFLRVCCWVHLCVRCPDYPSPFKEKHAVLQNVPCPVIILILKVSCHILATRLCSSCCSSHVFYLPSSWQVNFIYYVQETFGSKRTLKTVLSILFEGQQNLRNAHERVLQDATQLIGHSSQPSQRAFPTSCFLPSVFNLPRFFFFYFSSSLSAPQAKSPNQKNSMLSHISLSLLIIVAKDKKCKQLGESLMGKLDRYCGDLSLYKILYQLQLPG